MNNVKRFCFIFAIVLSLSFIAGAQDHNFPDVETDAPLSEAELINAFKGQTHQGTYSFVRRNFSSFGFSEETRADGTTYHLQQDRLDTGTWDISGERLCFNYDDSAHGNFSAYNPICFNIYQRGNCYYHYQVSLRGVAQYGFTARSVIDGERPNCEPSYI